MQGTALGNDRALFAKAILDYTKAIEINPEYISAYKLRGDMYKAVGKNKEAEADRTKASSLEKLQRLNGL